MSWRVLHFCGNVNSSGSVAVGLSGVDGEGIFEFSDPTFVVLN